MEIQKLKTFEAVDTALDDWLREGRGTRDCKLGRDMSAGGFLARLSLSNGSTVTGKSMFSTNDAIANALAIAVGEVA